ncbi:MAG: alpha/beta hydrolase family protein [Deinococcales bacterium]
MKHILVFIVALIGIALAQVLPSGATLISSRSQNGVLEQDLWYKSGSLRIRGRLFLPSGTGKLPAVLYNHGGVSGLSKLAATRCRELAASGFVVFASSYRGEDGSDGKIEVAKGEVDDVLAGFAWLKTHPRVDAARVAQFGTSHGALIGLLGSAKMTDFRALVFAYGIADIVAWHKHLVKTKQLADDQLTRDTYGNGPQDRPQSFAVRMGLTAVPKLPATMPVLIVQGGKDVIVPPEQAKSLQRELTKYGKPNTLRIYPNSEHGFVITREAAAKKSKAAGLEAWQAWADIVTFLKAQTR